MTCESYVATSVARALVARMQATHERRRISIFSGPPGIGKTTAIEALRSRHPEDVVVAKLGRRNTRESLALQHVVEAVRRHQGLAADHIPTGIWELRRALFGSICHLVAAEPVLARRDAYDFGTDSRLTIVFDEAQNLSREAIEALRFWNDGDRCYAPFPIGLVFVGNNEFSLAARDSAKSVISAAVADRALYVHELSYDDVSDDDLELMLENWGVTDRNAVRAVIRGFAKPRRARSFRRLLDVLETARKFSEGGEITQLNVEAALYG